MEIQSHSTGQGSRPQALSTDLVTQELGRETLVYNLKTDQACCLNETTAEVWRACDGKRSVTEISRLLSSELRTLVTEDIVWLALEQLNKHGLLTGSAELTVNFQGLSRRTLIKRAGLATIVALPAIASIVAPAAAQAASGTGGGNTNGACTDDCSVVGSVCGCPANDVTCAPGHLVSANVGAGVCVTAQTAAAVLGITVGAGAEGNVCLVAAACLL